MVTLTARWLHYQGNHKAKFWWSSIRISLQLVVGGGPHHLS